MSGPDDAPVLRVVRGDATPEEIAALVAVLAAAGGSAPAAPAPASRWAARDSAVRGGFAGSGALAPAGGPDAWRTSAWPR